MGIEPEVCREPPCTRPAVLLGFCSECLAVYRDQRHRGATARGRLTSRLRPLVDAEFPTWPEPWRRAVARSLAARLLAGDRRGGIWWRAMLDAFAQTLLGVESP